MNFIELKKYLSSVRKYTTVRLYRLDRIGSGHGGSTGFTLLEILVSLGISALIIGAVMGLISASLQHKFNLKEKSQLQPILESAAEIILADPVKAMDGSVQLNELSGSPVVGVSVVPVPLEDTRAGQKQFQLCRVMLNYKSGSLEFSVIIPAGDRK